jgi:protein phosphatase/serine/threonine-protein phosphatase Stp1
MTGLYGKLPAHGDFVRREVPKSFVEPWDQWLQTALQQAKETLGSEFTAVWETAPGWRFRLPAGACGPMAVVGVVLPSQDLVGRQFPLTLAAMLPDTLSPPNEAWYGAIERAGLAAIEQGENVENLLAQLPETEFGQSISLTATVPAIGWWTRDGLRWPLATLPSAAQFRGMLQGKALVERLESKAASHRGTVRTRNEDAYVDRGDIGVWAVADGAGGHGAGDVASAAAAAALADLPAGLSAAETLAQVRLRLGAVHADLQRRAAAGPSGSLIATTIVVLMARGEHFACLWAGDSRAYMLRDGSLSQMTQDHSLVQSMVAAGSLAAEDAESHPQANVITRAVGSHEALELDKVAGRLAPGDVLLLCTDGLFKALPEREIATLLRGGHGADQLIDEALRMGARDNVTALVIRA